MSERADSRRSDDICPRPEFVDQGVTRPISPPIYLAAVYQCTDPTQTEAMLGGQEYGYVYSRDKHPNADLLADKCRALHGAEQATICGSGMSAVSIATLALMAAGDHCVVSHQLYGRSMQLYKSEVTRLGMTSTIVDTCDLDAVRGAMRPTTKLIVVETITNPLLRVCDIGALAEIAHRGGAALLVDNTFAGPTIFRPLEHGADLVLESLTKIMNGHSDVLLGLLCGKTAQWGRVPTVSSTWGLSAAPFECWLAARGLGTLPLRMDRAAANAQKAAEFLTQCSQVERVAYPGLPSHPDHTLAQRQFGMQFGHMVTFHMRGGRAAAEAFIRAAKHIPFCPSLGDLCTTLSHPESTSHRTMDAIERGASGITGGTIRLSVGIESPEAVIEALREGMAGV